MKTIAQIGKAALIRLFTSKNFRSSDPDATVSFEFPKEECKLEEVTKCENTNAHYGNIQTFASSECYIWGIELGLKYVVLRENLSAKDAILKAMGQDRENILPTPSHVIFKESSSADHVGEDTTYRIYRLSQSQEQELAASIETGIWW